MRFECIISCRCRLVVFRVQTTDPQCTDGVVGHAYRPLASSAARQFQSQRTAFLYLQQGWTSHCKCNGRRDAHSMSTSVPNMALCMIFFSSRCFVAGLEFSVSFDEAVFVRYEDVVLEIYAIFAV